MAVFDVAQHVVNQSGSLIAGSTAVDGSTLATMQTTLEAMDVGPLFGIFLQSFAVKFLFEILSILIWAIVYGRMIEIYLTISLAPIPFATFGNREQSMIGILNHGMRSNLCSPGTDSFIFIRYHGLFVECPWYHITSCIHFV